MIARSTFVVVVWLGIAATAPALAQETGGSFGSSGSFGGGGGGGGGGRSWGGGGGGGGGGGSSRSWSSRPSRSSSSSSSSGGSSYSYAPAPPDPWKLARDHRGEPQSTYEERDARYPGSHLTVGGAALMISLFLGLAVLVNVWSGGPVRLLLPAVRQAGKADIRRITLAFGPAVRARIQGELSAMGALAGSSNAERHHAAQTVIEVMKDAHQQATHAQWTQDTVRSDVAVETLVRTADEYRTRYRRETQRNEMDGVESTSKPRREEGAGFVVVTLVVGLTRKGPRLPRRASRATLWDALDTFLPRSGDTCAGLEVVWSPSDPDDRMSSAELERKYPELPRLDPAGAIGERICASCRSPFAAELGECPSCGAPLERA